MEHIRFVVAVLLLVEFMVAVAHCITHFALSEQFNTSSYIIAPISMLLIMAFARMVAPLLDFIIK